MENHDRRSFAQCPSRREALWKLGGGLGGIALASMLNQDGWMAASAASESVGSGSAARPPRARCMIQLYMSGAASQCDTFDYKPRLIREHGQPWNPGVHVELFQSDPGVTMQSPWPWRQYGQSGKWINDCVAPLGACVDDMAFVHNLASKSNVHGPATFLQATGFVLPGFPSVGAWISYGLGSETENLPAFVVLPDPRGFAPNGPKNWSAGFLPTQHQGTMIRPSAKNPIDNLFPRAALANSRGTDEDVQRALRELNLRHQQARSEDLRLEARIRSYELAAKMQLSAPQLLDLSDESQPILDLYGIDAPQAKVHAEDPMDAGEETRYFGRNCLIARRLVERGVRFVQVWSGADNAFPRRNWDSHEDLRRDHWPLGQGMARGAAALLRDLKQRGLLDDTIVLWTTEFGRMPCSQGSLGRDHNPTAFTNWLAGGGIRGGVSFGPSDEWSWRSLDPDRPTFGYDIHATLLYLLGIDHTQLTYRHNGIDRRLTDVHGHVLQELVA